MSERLFEIRDPFSGSETASGETLEAAIESLYADVPEEERPAYVWFDGQRIDVPGGRCHPTQ